jgi:hypothetical protein
MMTRRRSLAVLCGAGGVFLSGGFRAMGNIKVLFVAGFGPIVRDRDASRKLYVDTLEIPFKEEKDGYLHTDDLKGAKSFAMATLSSGAVLLWQRFLARRRSGPSGMA